MRKIISLIIVTMLSICVLACGSSASEPSVPRSELIGDWIQVDDGITQYLTLTDDGRHITETVSDMGFSLSSESTWTYEDGVFTVNYTDYGVTSVYNKVILEGDTLTLDNGEGQIVYKRR